MVGRSVESQNKTFNLDHLSAYVSKQRLKNVWPPTSTLIEKRVGHASSIQNIQSWNWSDSKVYTFWACQGTYGKLLTRTLLWKSLGA